MPSNLSANALPPLPLPLPLVRFVRSEHHPLARPSPAYGAITNTLTRDVEGRSTRWEIGNGNGNGKLVYVPVFDAAFWKALNMSTGSGNTIVVFFSTPISTNVCR